MRVRCRWPPSACSPVCVSCASCARCPWPLGACSPDQALYAVRAWCWWHRWSPHPLLFFFFVLGVCCFLGFLLLEREGKRGQGGSRTVQAGGGAVGAMVQQYCVPCRVVRPLCISGSRAPRARLACHNLHGSGCVPLCVSVTLRVGFIGVTRGSGGFGGSGGIDGFGCGSWLLFCFGERVKLGGLGAVGHGRCSPACVLVSNPPVSFKLWVWLVGVSRGSGGFGLLGGSHGFWRGICLLFLLS